MTAFAFRRSWAVDCEVMLLRDWARSEAFMVMIKTLPLSMWPIFWFNGNIKMSSNKTNTTCACVWLCARVFDGKMIFRCFLCITGCCCCCWWWFLIVSMFSTLRLNLQSSFQTADEDQHFGVRTKDTISTGFQLNLARVSFFVEVMLFKMLFVYQKIMRVARCRV